MWLSDRRRFLTLLAAAPLAACGFTPALAPGGSLAGLRGRVRVADPDDRNEFALKSALEQRLGTGADFDLTYQIDITETDAGITPDQVITRRQIDGTATFTLSDRASGATLMFGLVDGFTSYGTTGTTASTAFARTDAFERLMVILADRIVTRLATLAEVPA